MNNRKPNQTMMISRFLMLVLLFIFASCEKQYQYSNIDYESLKRPSDIFDLPDELDEISGLEMYGENEIIAIDDEDGIIYSINTESGKITSTVDFGVKGDFEGLAYDGKYMYVITSGGDLYQIDPASPRNYGKYHWDIEGKEIESLAFFEGKLYSTTKERSNSQEMVIFALEPERLGSSQPEKIMTIKLESVKSFLAQDEDKSILKRFAKFISGDNIYNFVRPSGITFIPGINHVLILSHHNRFLLEIDPEGEIHNIMSLSCPDFYQPEGIALDANGYLYISNESRGHLPNVLKFKYR